MKDYSKNIEPISDDEIKQIKKNVRNRYEKQSKGIGYAMLITGIILVLAMAICTVKVLEYHTITLLGSIIITNMIAQIVIKKYYANRYKK